MANLTWQQIEQTYGPQSKSDSPFTRRSRLLQSWYRVEFLKQMACGPWTPGRAMVGSTLVDGHITGANFLSTEAFEYAKAKVREKKSNPDLTIDEYRLFNNMLSSQPMCFNLFSDIRAAVARGSAAAQSVLAAMFPESDIGAVEQVEVELIPRPTHEYIDDKTAFDAAVLFRGADGRPGIASIETKYTDHLGANRASKEGIKHRLSEELGLFTAEGQLWVADRSFDQVARNLLLTLAYARKQGRPNAINYVLSLQEDDEASDTVERLRGRLAEAFRPSIVWLPLQELVRRGLTVADASLAAVLRMFQQRYLDFGPVDALVGR